jgi:hypothetical protein
MRKTVFSVIFFLSLFLFIASAQAETSLKAEVDKTNITTDDELTYKLVISSSAKKIPQPKLPKFEGFVVLSKAQTSQISIVKGVQKAFVIYVFILAPAQTGTLKIEPSHIQVEEKDYSSDGFEIVVTQGEAEPRPKSEPEPSLPEEFPQESGQPQVTL